MIAEDPRAITIAALRIEQPIGEIYVGSMSSSQLYDIAHFDVRRIVPEGGLDQYLGIQRELNNQRVKIIRQYVRGIDASFPTSIVLALDEKCVSLANPCEDAPEFFKMTLSNFGEDEAGNSTQVSMFRSIAPVIDGQHRIAGLEGNDGPQFDLNVSIFVGADIADQAAVFSAVNLTQTKANRSLAYDLYELSQSRSPERTAHDVTVALDRIEDSPLHKRIKRLGKSTPGRIGETLSQAVVVNSILDYISGTQDRVLKDRQIGRKSGRWPEPTLDEQSKLIFRKMFVESRDTEIANSLLNYFGAVRLRWPKAWDVLEPGLMLNRTNGFMGLMRFLRPLYNSTTKAGDVLTLGNAINVFESIKLEKDDFNIETFVPGTSGATKLYNVLLEQSGLG